MKILKSKLSSFALFAAFMHAAGACAFAESAYLDEESFYDEEVTTGPFVSDPLESLNRVTFEVNDFIYLNLLEPLADGYSAITPDPVEEGAMNFFANLKYPIRLAGNLLQGRLQGAWVETGRFAVNSTVGLAGIFRPADGVSGLEPIPAEDIGQALGAWGVGEGPYLVLPLLGPSNLRDFGGYIGDRAVNPLQEPFSVINDWNWEWRYALTGAEIITTSPTLIQRYKQLKGNAIDPYGSMKDGYTQLRRSAIRD